MQALEVLITLEAMDTTLTEVEAEVVEVVVDQKGAVGRGTTTEGAAVEEETAQRVKAKWALDAVGKEAEVLEVVLGDGAD